MNKIIYLFILLFTIAGFAQKSVNSRALSRSQDSIQTFYNKLFKVVKNSYVYRKDVNWNDIETTVKNNLGQYQNFEGSLKEVTTLLNFIKADHSKVFYNKAFYTGDFPAPSKEDFSDQWLKKFRAKPEFEVKVLDSNIGYILMPGIITQDLSAENIHNISQAMYDEIYKIKSSGNIEGWIIDLRFNTGGNCEPMLLALYDFLGDNTIWGIINQNKKKVSSIKLLNGTYYTDSYKMSYVDKRGQLMDNAKVAVITNFATGSSGEVTTLAFKGRKNTAFIGEKTNGKTTSNMVINLPYGAYIILSTGLDCDRNGNFYTHITPDITVYKKDNFENLLLDQNITEAIRFIRSE